MWAWGKRVGLLVAALLFVCAAVEAGFRLTFSPEEIEGYIAAPEPPEGGLWVDHPFFPFIGRPGADYQVDVPPGVRIHVRNNSFGFRSHELPAAKSPSDYFVVALGESTTWGAAAESNATTWPELLEARLRVRYPERNVRVFNFGTQNVTLPYSVVALALIGASIRPDLVVVYHGFNELGPATALGYRSDHAHFFKDLAIGHRWLGFQRSLPPAFLSSYALAYLSARADRRIGANNLSFYVQHPLEFDQEAGDEEMKRALTREWGHFRTIDAIARAGGGSALFSTFQFYDGDDPSRRIVNETLRAFFAAHDFDYVDQDALIPDYDRSLQFDPCHFTRAGDEMMAENFFEHIVERGHLEP